MSNSHFTGSSYGINYYFAEDMISPGVVKQYLDSDRPRMAETLLEKENALNFITITNHMLIRNYIILLICLANFQRPGAIYNLKLNQPA